MAKKKTPKPKLPKKHTPKQEANKATKQRNQQRKDTIREHDGIGKMMNSTETRSKDDFSQPAVRVVREATKD
ncbi:MAG: hypothetical protein ABSG52_02525 [Terriglobales bacterium]|jgi:hypothetical protein